MKPQVAKGKPAFRKSLRNAAINYRNGWFFVTSQVAHNKSIFGAIVGERCELNAYWDKLITDERQFAAIAKYIRENPANWSRDRYGAVTSHYLGNLALLNRPRIAFVASQGFFASELRPRWVWGRARGAPAKRL